MSGNLHGHHAAAAYEAVYAARDAALPASMRNYGLLSWSDDDDLGVRKISGVDCMSRVRARGSVGLQVPGQLFEASSTLAPEIGTENGRRCPVYTAGRVLLAESAASSRWEPGYTASGVCTWSILIRVDTLSTNVQIARCTTFAGTGFAIAKTTGNSPYFAILEGATVRVNAIGAAWSSTGLYRMDCTKNGLSVVLRVNGAVAASGTAPSMAASGVAEVPLSFGASLGGGGPLAGAILATYYHPTAVIPDADLDGGWRTLLQSVWGAGVP